MKEIGNYPYDIMQTQDEFFENLYLYIYLYATVMYVSPISASLELRDKFEMVVSMLLMEHRGLLVRRYLVLFQAIDVKHQASNIPNRHTQRPFHKMVHVIREIIE